MLSWNLQTDSISKKLVFIISRVSRLKPVLPSQMLMYIYSSIIQPKIDYAISIWGYTTAHNINKVQRLQNRAARILTGNFDYVNTRGIDLVKNLGLMNVTQRRDYLMLIMMFKSIHGLVPDYICDEITRHSNTLGIGVCVNSPTSSMQSCKAARCQTNGERASSHLSIKTREIT